MRFLESSPVMSGNVRTPWKCIPEDARGDIPLMFRWTVGESPSLDAAGRPKVMACGSSGLLGREEHCIGCSSIPAKGSLPPMRSWVRMATEPLPELRATLPGS